MMSINIKDNTPQVIANTEQKASIFLRLMAEDIVATATPNTPKDTGRLRMDVVKQVLGLKGKVVWGKKYAIFQEVKQYQRYTTPGTGSKFAENAAKQAPQKTAKIARIAGL
jgi:hypothetical protein